MRSIWQSTWMIVSASVACSPVSYDGTTGRPCATDADCTSPGGPGIARCSNSVFAPDDYYPTPVCILPTCSPVSDRTLQYCDGPGQAGGAGVCIQSGSTGVCYPVCYYDMNGGPPTGCQGKDTCIPYGPAGYGYCWGGCTKDSDCQVGQHCQTDRGVCLAEVVPPTKAIGAPCNGVSDNEVGACNCIGGGESGAGYCESFCIVGDGASCPDGFVCGANEPILTYSVQNPGIAGRCHLKCSGADAGTGCPAGTNSTCSYEWAGGPYCTVP
jgi:hypothetical protein